MKLNLSVIICTHNPKPEYITRVVTALKSQTLSLEQWELLLIDNASDEPLYDWISLFWHPNARHIREDRLGLTPARLRGIQESQSEILVFVDDDNVLNADYLEIALQISSQWTILGAWGGQILPEFEEHPPEWTKPFWGNLAIREFALDKWSNLVDGDDTKPWGAGLCVRKVVGQKYAESIEKDPNRVKLDRKGKSLLAGGDKDLVLTACDIGLGTGLFTALKLTHIIPANRLQEDYLLMLIEGLTYSSIILDTFRGKIAPSYSWKAKILNHVRRWFLSRRERRFRDAHFRGINLAIQEINK